MGTGAGERGQEVHRTLLCRCLGLGAHLPCEWGIRKAICREIENLTLPQLFRNVASQVTSLCVLHASVCELVQNSSKGKVYVYGPTTLVKSPIPGSLLEIC